MNSHSAVRFAAIALLFTFMALPAPSAPQDISATERVPTNDWMNRYPRWLTPTVVDATYQWNFTSRVRGNGTSLTSVSVDSRNVAHVVGIVDTNAGTPVQGSPIDWNYEPVIAYWNNRFDTRRNNGFSVRETILTVPDGRSITGAPDVWVDSQDRIHVVWTMDNPQLVGLPAGGNTTRIPSDVWYAMKGLNGLWAVSNLTNCVAQWNFEERYTLPQIQVGTDNLPQIVCYKDLRYSGADYSRVAWLQGQNTELLNDSQTEYWSYLFGYSPPRFTLNAANQPIVVWADMETGYGSCYSIRNAGWAPKVNIPGGGGWPDVAVDLQGAMHFVVERLTPQGDPNGIWYVNPAGMQTRLNYSIGIDGGRSFDPDQYFGQPHILCDSRGQVHIIYSGDGTYNNGPVSEGIFYAARVRNPGSSLSSTFSGQMPIASPTVEVPFPMMYNGTLLNHATHIAISKNDQIHLVGMGMEPDGMDMAQWENSDNYYGLYTRTMEYNLGSMDSAAMVNAMPGGAVNVTNGNLHYRAPLFSTKGIAPCQNVELIHNSLEQYSGLLAQGWKLNYEVYLIDHWLTISQPGGTSPPRPPDDLLYGPDCLTLFLPDGRAVYFRFNGNYLIPDESYGYFSRIERLSFMTLSPEYRLTTRHGTEWTFNSQGKLYRIEEHSGNRIELTYNGSGLLTNITDQTTGSGGRQTSLQYTSPTNLNHAPRIQSIVDPAMKGYAITYSGSGLSSIVRPEASVFEFVVGAMNDEPNGERVNLIRTIITPNGSDWICSYLLDNRLIQIEDPPAPYLLDSAGDSSSPTQNVATISFDYEEPNVPDPPPPIGQPRDTWVTDRRGYETKYEYDARRSLILEIHDPTVSGGSAPSGIFPVLREFDPYGNLVQLTDRWGTSTTYAYFTTHAAYPYLRDNLQSITRASIMIKSFTYTSDGLNKVATETTYASPTGGGSAVGRTTTFQYSPQSGDVALISYPQVTLADNSSQNAAKSFTYMGPRSGLSSVNNEIGVSVDYGNFHSVHGLPQTISKAGASQIEEILYDVMGNVLQRRIPQGDEGNSAPSWSVYTLDDLYRVEHAVEGGVVTEYEYDFESNLITVDPPAGDNLTYTYCPRGYLLGGSTPDGNWVQAVDANGNVRRMTDVRTESTNMSYDSLNRLTQTRSPGGTNVGGNGGGYAVETTTYGHDLYQSGSHRMTITRSAQGGNSRVTTQIFDSVGRVTEVREPDGATSVFNFYDQQDSLIATQTVYESTVQRCKLYYRDRRDRVYRVRSQNVGYGSNPSWSEDTYKVFDGAGNPTLTVGPRGNPTDSNDLTDKVSYVYDGRGRLQNTRVPYNDQWVTVKQNLYGDDDLVKEVKTPDPTSASGSLVTSTVYTYTGRKELKTVKNANNKGLTYTYGSLPGQVATITDANNSVTHHTYHSATQRLNEVTEDWSGPDEKKTIHTWEGGMLTQKSTWNPASEAYDADWQYHHDSAGRLERLESPEGDAEIYRYNEFSERDQVTIGQKVVTSTYNGMGREIARSVTGSYSASFSYSRDGDGNITQVSDGMLRKDIAWNVARKLPTSESFYVNDELWVTQNHGYDMGGNYVSLEDPTSTTHEWIRDEANRVIGIQVAGTEVCSMAYRPGGQLRMTVLRSASGAPIAQTVHDYDSLGRHVRALTTRLPSQATLSDIRWEHDHLDRIVKIEYVHLGIETEIGYNGRGEIISEDTDGNGNGVECPPYENQYNGPAIGNDSLPSDEVSAMPGAIMPVANRSASYTYDKNGNRISQTIDGVTTTLLYSSSNRLISESRSGRTVAHDYDDDGNEIERVTSEGGTETTETFGYDAQNRLSTYTRSIGSTVQAQWQYDYWPTGERYGKFNLLAASAGQLYISHSDNVVAEYSYSSGSISLQNTYAQGLGLDQKSVRIPVSGSRIHYLGDGVGTLSMTLTDSGAPSEECVRDVWGNVLTGDTNNERYGFAQREHDMESGLVYMRNRLYDPRVGRFTQLDPIRMRQLRSHYSYGHNAPITYTDPTGLWEESGHFFTTYIVSVIVGRQKGLGEARSKSDAFKLAYYSQLPDEVKEFEAVENVIAWATEGIAYVAAEKLMAGAYDKLHPGREERNRYRRDVNEFVHSLHGGDVEHRRKGLANMVKAEKDPAARGVLIHAFGDSFAHTYAKESALHAYAWPLGHGLTSGGGMITDFVKQHSDGAIDLGGINPDHVGDHNDAYLQWVDALYSALGGDPRKTKELNELKEFSKTFIGRKILNQNEEYEKFARKYYGYESKYSPLEDWSVDKGMNNLDRTWMRSLMDRMTTELAK